MATKNNITGDEIKSGIYSKQGRFNYELIFSKKSAQEWIEFLPEYRNYRILDPDGWRWDDGVNLETKVSYSEFIKRFNHCTVMFYGEV